MGEGVCWTGYCLPCWWAPRTYDWMLFQGKHPDSGFPFPTHTAMFSRNPLPAACHRCELLQNEAKGWEDVCTRVFVHLCVPLSLNLCLCTQVCVYAGQCVLVSLNSYMCPCVCVHLYDKGPGVSRWAAPPPTGLPPSQGLSPTRQRQELKLTSQRLCLVIYL